jgi:hypothetical protein
MMSFHDSHKYLSNCHKYKLVNDVKMTNQIVLNDIVRNTDKLNTIKMTREIPEIVDDNIVSSRILVMTKLTTEFRV